MARRYRVLLPLAFAQPGDELSADEPYGTPPLTLSYDGLVAGGFVEEIAPSVACPACTEQGLKKKDVPNFQKAETLEEHYRKEHPALVAPDFEEVV